MATTRGPSDARGRRGAWSAFQRHHYVDAPADLAAFVERYWFAEWDLRGQAAYRQTVLPSASVHLSFRAGTTDDGVLLTGVHRGPLTRVLHGTGRVFGVAFQPGGFRAFLGAPVSTLTGRTVPAVDVLGPAVPQRAVLAAADECAMRAIVQDFLRASQPDPDPAAELAGAAVRAIAARPAGLRVDTVARDAGLSVRSLQRLFAEYVGVGPKWVIRRYRLQEITERLARGEPVDWAGLAAELGYADQAHLIRDFADLTGEPPGWHAERYPAR